MNRSGKKIKTANYRKTILNICIAAAVLGGAAVLYFHNPASTAWLPSCPFHSLTGMYCSGCGTTRALYAALHGDFYAALKYNILLFPAILLLGAIIIKPDLPRKPWLAYTILVIILLYWIMRNIPFYPFVMLAPQ